jgi:hypothetical protein
VNVVEVACQRAQVLMAAAACVRQVNEGEVGEVEVSEAMEAG